MKVEIVIKAINELGVPLLRVPWSVSDVTKIFTKT